MNGGLGNYTYVVDVLGDVIIESSPAGGTDTVQLDGQLRADRQCREPDPRRLPPAASPAPATPSPTPSPATRVTTSSTGAAGDDTLVGGTGNDTLNGQSGHKHANREGPREGVKSSSSTPPRSFPRAPGATVLDHILDYNQGNTRRPGPGGRTRRHAGSSRHLWQRRCSATASSSAISCGCRRINRHRRIPAD